ncbi:MFS transporter [Apilactobacillus timberlakei]|uniref:DHA2 family efflux MFS transporter permease subunit n=1 Tax=Apilactobacillus timberlakei TaxID=2008380 RepID=A0ABY2YSI7_9LACO|nr:MFS transporter [Apilactobacillus timberlakei]TPR13162.1 DHA2 family efflux MFS transporter permease subunit [Apilactobacillus timberlakei]TPR14212.1 DHA2 family efflux MFS transporter permease subunit [Apilactobacillus timberlakei]TPR16465.1 DHA2 family efflux MFS transporter permease subunit [Apilactobacillus timberlakei]
MIKKKFILPVLMLATILCMMDVSIMTILLPDIQTAFNQILENLSWTINVYTIVFATLIIPFGRLAEKIGQNKFVFIGLIVFGTGSFLSGFSSNLPIMLCARFIQSVGAAAIIPTSMVIGISHFSVKNRNKVVAALAGSQGLAVAIGPSFGGTIAQYLSWRWAFYINVPLVLIALIIFACILPMHNEKTNNAKIDYIGSILSMITLFALSLGLVQGNNWGWSSLLTISLFIGSAGAFILFLIVELKSSHPMIDMYLFKSRNFNGASLALILANFLLGGFAALIPTFLTRIHGQSELNAALIITPYSIAVMFSTITSSLLVKKLNKKLFIGAGFIIMAIGYYFLSIMNVSKNYHQLLIGAIALGLGYGMVAATANILAVSDFKGSLLTDSQSVSNVLRQVGIVIAIATFMTLLSGNVRNAKQNTLNYAKSRVANLNLSTSVKRKINNKLDHKLNPNSNNVTNVKNSVSFDGEKISQKQRETKINDVYNDKLTLLAFKNNVSESKIPQAMKTKLKGIIMQKVNNKINDTLRKDNYKINNLLHDIKHHAKHQLNKSFLDIYKVMLLIPIIALLVLPIFKFDKKI